MKFLDKVVGTIIIVLLLVLLLWIIPWGNDKKDDVSDPVAAARRQMEEQGARDHQAWLNKQQGGANVQATATQTRPVQKVRIWVPPCNDPKPWSSAVDPSGMAKPVGSTIAHDGVDYLGEYVDNTRVNRFGRPEKVKLTWMAEDREVGEHLIIALNNDFQNELVIDKSRDEFYGRIETPETARSKVDPVQPGMKFHQHTGNIWCARWRSKVNRGTWITVEWVDAKAL
jgi:hypothetical protein